MPRFTANKAAHDIQSGCRGKKRYDSRAEAKEQGKWIGVQTGGLKLRVYPCAFCNGYHLAKRQR